VISEQQHRLTGFAPQQKAAKGDHPISASMTPTQSARVNPYIRRRTLTGSHSTHQHIGVGRDLHGLGPAPGKPAQPAAAASFSSSKLAR